MIFEGHIQMAQRVRNLSIKNFGAFKELEMKCSPGINVVMGANSTGKTFLLKVIYHLFRVATILDPQAINSVELYKKIINDLRNIFDPRSEIDSLIYNESAEDALLKAELENENVIITNIFPTTHKVNNESMKQIEKEEASVFVPSKELMYFLPQLNSVAKEYELLVDLTIRELLDFLSRPNLIPERMQELTKSILKDIEHQIGGRFFLASDGSIKFSNEGWVSKPVTRSANLIAEGYRKFGILARLLETGSLVPGRSGPLLLDEPETNLNPSMMRSLVEILIELSRNGQQIIFATHSYVILKWFEILLDPDKGDSVLYHNLKRNENSDDIELLTTENYSDIIKNSISEAYSSLTDFDITKRTEEFSKRMEKNT